MSTTLLKATDGAQAELDDDVLRVRAPDGTALFEYQAGRCVLHAPEELQLRAPRIALVAEESVRIESPKLSSVVQKVEIRAERLVERVKEAYREVENLSQTRAGRVRQIARGTFQLLAERTVLKAEEDVKLKGAHIHLG